MSREIHVKIVGDCHQFVRELKRVRRQMLWLKWRLRIKRWTGAW